MGLLRGDVVDARMVMLGVVPGKVPFEIGNGLAVVQEAAGIFRGAFDGAEGGLDERIVIGVRGRANNWGMPWASHTRWIGLAFIWRPRSLMTSGR